MQRLVLDGAARWWAWCAVQGVRAASAVCEAWASSRVRSVAHRTAAVEVVMSTRVSGSRRACAYGTVARRGESRQVPEGKEGGGGSGGSERGVCRRGMDERAFWVLWVLCVVGSRGLRVWGGLFEGGWCVALRA